VPAVQSLIRESEHSASPDGDADERPLYTTENEGGRDEP
jgi:hypothetical protein